MDSLDVTPNGSDAFSPIFSDPGEIRLDRGSATLDILTNFEDLSVDCIQGIASSFEFGCKLVEPLSVVEMTLNLVAV